MTMKKIFKEIHLDDKLTQDEALAKQQIHNADYILDKTGLDLVTCGNCGTIQTIYSGHESQECYSCGFTADSCDFPSLFFDGMTIMKDEPQLDAISKAQEHLKGFGLETKRSGETLWIVTNGTSLKLSDDEIDWRATQYELKQKENK